MLKYQWTSQLLVLREKKNPLFALCLCYIKKKKLFYSYFVVIIISLFFFVVVKFGFLYWKWDCQQIGRNYLSDLKN